MYVDESRGTFEDIIRISEPAAAEIALSLRRLIQDLFPDIMEISRPAEQHADYGVGAGKWWMLLSISARSKRMFVWGSITGNPFLIRPGC